MNVFPFSLMLLWFLLPTTFPITTLHLLLTKIQWQHCPKLHAYNEPLRAEQHCTCTSVSCEVSKTTTPLSVVWVCLVNTVFTAGPVPHYLTFDFSLFTLHTKIQFEMFQTSTMQSLSWQRQPLGRKTRRENPMLEVRIECVFELDIVSLHWWYLAQPGFFYLKLRFSTQWLAFKLLTGMFVSKSTLSAGDSAAL